MLVSYPNNQLRVVEPGFPGDGQTRACPWGMVN